MGYDKPFSKPVGLKERTKEEASEKPKPRKINAWHDSFTEQAYAFFEPQLTALDLGAEQIETQSLDELYESLERIEDSLGNPELFGVLRLKASTSGIALVSGVDSQIEVGALPLLLQRKKLIKERIKELREQSPIENLDELLESLTDESLRERMLTELEAIRAQKVTHHDVPIRENYAFIAMSMDPNDPTLDDVLDAIKEGASSCGIHAERIDEEQTNERITDRMLDSIIESEFVVVDLSDARPNVYYEAGFAQGMGKTPVYVAKDGTNLHFDLRDYPVIFYPNMRTLKNELRERLKSINSGRKAK